MEVRRPTLLFNMKSMNTSTFLLSVTRHYLLISKAIMQACTGIRPLSFKLSGKPVRGSYLSQRKHSTFPLPRVPTAHCKVCLWLLREPWKIVDELNQKAHFAERHFILKRFRLELSIWYSEHNQQRWILPSGGILPLYKLRSCFSKLNFIALDHKHWRPPRVSHCKAGRS